MSKERMIQMRGTVYLRRYWQLYALLVLPLVYFIIFKYGPMWGVQIARISISSRASPEANGLDWMPSEKSSRHRTFIKHCATH